MSAPPSLSAAEQRILGCLLEKERTVPASYPLSLNALRTACNQSSSREPVVDYDERFVEETARELKQRGLVRIVWADSGRRTLKYVQTLSEELSLAEDERAVLTVMLLRGPQATGELKTRTERLHPFADRSDVETTLTRLADRAAPLVRELPRRAGERDPRWTHLFGDEPVADPVPAPALAARDPVERQRAVAASYGAVARPYAEEVAEVLDQQPFERWLLDRVALHALGPVVEVGTGPGHVAAYLADAGVDVSGLDVVPEMVEVARERHPEVRFEVGDLRQLMRPAGADGWAAVVAWHSLIHLSADEVEPALRALVRPLAPGGVLVVAAHCGLERPVHQPGGHHLDTWFDTEVDLDFTFLPAQQWTSLFSAAGLEQVESYVRSPIERRGELTFRAFVWGVKP